MKPERSRTKLAVLLLAICALAALAITSAAGGATYEELPDPLKDGSYSVKKVDPLKLGLTTLQEPNGEGKEPTGSNESITLQVRGLMWMPQGRSEPSPLIVLVHGNHSQCDEGSGPECGIFKRNDEGYNYLAKNLASWGYIVASLDQDQLMARQDSRFGKGMHARRLLIMAMLDGLKAANEEAQPVTEDSNVGGSLVGRIDMTRIGLMGHSRGGDAVSSFVEYDHTRPAGERYPLRGVISLAPVDYERHAPYGVPYMTVFGSCDGDVSNLQGARLYERSQYATNDPYPRFQVVQVGGNHDAYNTVWQADGDDAYTRPGRGTPDAACQPDYGYESSSKTWGPVSSPHSIRLSGEAGPLFTEPRGEAPYEIDNSEKLNPSVNTRISAEAGRMGDQEKLGLATMAAFFRRYVGGEGAFEPYLTGELAAEGKPSVPLSACPTSTAGKRIPCIDRVADSYTAAPDERLDVLRPDTEHPTTLSAMGTKIEASGFANPYPADGGVTPRPETTANGIDWCDPDPKQAEPGQMNEGTYPTVAKWCPQPAMNTLGGQGKFEEDSPREQAPVNGSYGRQLSLAWEGPAKLSTMIPAADGNVSGYKALYMSAAVNFFDPRNPARGEEGEWNPEAAPQNFTIAVTDAEGHEATVQAGDPRYGTALQQTLGSTSFRVHVLLRDLRVPLSDLASQGVDLTKVRKLELRFGEAGMPSSGSIQLADVRFQQPASGYSNVLLDSTEPYAGPAVGEPASGPNPVEEMDHGVYKRADGSFEIPNVTKVAGANVWTVDDDKAQCPNAEFTKIQTAVEFASPWDTIVVCPGTYEEESTPVASKGNPVETGAMNGLTINKPLKIVGAGASEVTIKPAASLGSSLAGTEPFLRDGGGNVVTVSRQSLGSSEYTENYVDISGVTIESPNAYVEAGVSFFNTSGRIADSVVGPLKRAANPTELGEEPHGWGVIATNSLLGSGEGTVERQVTITHSKVYGYQSGGIRFDDAAGEDEAATATEPSGIEEVGYVEDSTVEGSGADALIPQTGIQYHAGASGKVTGSSIVGNLFPSEPRESVGVLLTEAGAFSIGKSLIAENGYGLFNADAANASIREAAPADAAENYWGTAGTPVEGPSVIGGGSDEEGISGEDSAPAPSVEYTPVLGSAPTIPAVAALLPDAAPVGAIVNPGDGEAVEAGEAIEPVVATEDDYGVKAVSLTVDGTPLETQAEAPYAFSWTPTDADVGKTVTLAAKIVDSSGQTTTSTVAVPVTKAVPPAEEPPVTNPTAPTPPTPPGHEVGFHKIKRLRHKGIALIKVHVPGPGTLFAYGHGIKKVKRQVKAAGNVTVAIRPNGKALKVLRKRGWVKVKVKVLFAPTGGTPFVKKRTVVLVKTHHMHKKHRRHH